MMTKFSFEVPIKHLCDFHEDQDYIFSLSFLFQEPDYCKYIELNQKLHILDNSYNELGEPQSLESMLRIYKNYPTNLLVCPDSDQWDSKRTFMSFAEAVSIIGTDQVIGIGRSQTEIRGLTRLGCRYLAIPFEHRLCLPIPTFSPIHFLGLNNLMELLAYEPETVDTSMPIKLALIRKTIDQWVLGGCPHINTKDLIKSCDFFHMKMKVAEVKLAKTNIQRLKEVVSYGQNFNGILH
jgi:hypothetical protein